MRQMPGVQLESFCTPNKSDQVKAWSFSLWYVYATHYCIPQQHM